MRKLIALILILALALPVVSFADIPDISTLSKEELLELNRNIQFMLFSDELVNGIRIPQGKYIIGEDIPAGTYRIEITDGSGFYEVHDKKGWLKNSGITGDSYNITDIGKLYLEDGYELSLVNSTFVFYPYTGVFH